MKNYKYYPGDEEEDKNDNGDGPEPGGPGT